MSEDDTTLVLTGLGVTPYSARGLTERLAPLGAGALRRTVNGTLVDVTDTLFRKYALSLSANDQEPPAFDLAWRGLQVTVDLVGRLAYATGGSPGRTIVPGSSVVVSGLSGDPDFTTYRPRLIMLIAAWTLERDEWGAMTSWSLDLEEV